MVDRIAEIREALASFARHEPELPKTRLKTVLSAARAYADLLESDALIIRRDENGRWDTEAVEAMYPPLDAWDAFLDWQGVVEAQLDALAGHLDLDALASSQVVEEML